MITGPPLGIDITWYVDSNDQLVETPTMIAHPQKLRNTERSLLLGSGKQFWFA